jgi:large subunit ribosomal protein L30
MAEKKVKKTEEAAKKLRVTLVKSTIGCLEKQKRTVEALGLKKIGSVKIHADNPVIQGMIFVVKHLVTVTEV